MQRRIRMGEGKVEVCCGYQDGVPTLNFIIHEKVFKIGEQTRDVPCKIEDDYLIKHNAVVIEFPEFKSVDIVLDKIMEMWQYKKILEWDGVNELEENAKKLMD